MTRDEFTEHYNNMVDRARCFSEIARKNGLLPLEDELHEMQQKKKIISESGLCLKLKRLLDRMQESLIKKGIDLREISTEEAPILFRLIYDLRYSIIQNKLSKFLIKNIKDEKGIFEFGIYLVISGVDCAIVYDKLFNITKREKDPYMRILKNRTIDAVIFMEKGTNSNTMTEALRGALTYHLCEMT
jgi:hypothetical protein